MSQSRVIRVFLSSTFRDFGEERDLLVKKVFPELRSLCRKRQVELIDVDLRWGITEKEAQQGKVLPICLAEIDLARPYFMGFIGDRYGWMPASEQYPEVVLDREPWLREHMGGKSVTELEMLHGVLNNPAMAGRAFFYFRDSGYSKSKGGDYEAESPEHATKLEALRERLRESEFPVVEAYPTPEALAERVREDLLALIEEEYPEAEVPDEATLEALRHEAYGATRRRLYLGKDGAVAALSEAVDRVEGSRAVLITAEAGVGKSALIANWLPAWREQNPSVEVVLHHVAASAEAADPVKMVRRFMRTVAATTGEAIEEPTDPSDVLAELPQVLAHASRHSQANGRSWLFVIDGVEGFTSHEHMRWFPRALPQGVRLLISCSKGETSERLSGHLDWSEIGINRFEAAQRREYISTYLGKFRKKLPLALEEVIIGHPLSGHPLWLKTLLEELRLFGKHEEVAKRLETLLSAPPSKPEGEQLTIDDLFEHVLERIDGDVGGGLGPAMKALWASHDGLARPELLELSGMSPMEWAEIEVAIDTNLFESRGQVELANGFIRKAVEDMYLPTDDIKREAHRWLAGWFEGREVTLDVAKERAYGWQQAGDNGELKRTLLEREVFRELYEADEHELLGLWVGVGGNIEESYAGVFEAWEEQGDVLEPLIWFLSLAGCYGDFAESLNKRQLDERERTLGDEHPDTLNSINELAGLYADQGRYDEAEPLYLRALEAKERTFGEEHPFTLVSRGNLAVLYKKQGRYDEAEPLFLRALEARERTLGMEHPSTLSSVGNLAGLYTIQGRYDAAEPLILRELKATARTLGEEHPNTLTSVNNLAGMYSHQGRFDEAEPLYLRDLEACERTLGMEHPHTTTSANNLALMYKKQGRYDEAEPLYLRALAARARTLGEEHPYTTTSLNNLALLYNKQGRCKKAEPLYLRALEARARTLGEEHPSTLTSVYNLALLYKKQERYDEAEPLFLRELKATARTLGEEHPNTLTSVNNLAGMYSDQGRYDEAEPLYLRALAAWARTLGEEHPSTLTSFVDLATLYSDQGRYHDAEPLYLRALEAQERTLGMEHPHTLISAGCLGTLYVYQCRYKMAEPLTLRVLEGMTRTLGEEHPHTLISVNNLAWLQLEHTETIPTDAFKRLLGGWNQPTDWTHHWAKLGLALCECKTTGDITASEAVLTDLIGLIGEDHDRVQSARDKIATIGRQSGSPAIA
jgi:tetratricopeptide (TPR) repeat protein